MQYNGLMRGDTATIAGRNFTIYRYYDEENSRSYLYMGFHSDGPLDVWDNISELLDGIEVRRFWLFTDDREDFFFLHDHVMFSKIKNMETFINNINRIYDGDKSLIQSIPDEYERKELGLLCH